MLLSLLPKFPSQNTQELTIYIYMYVLQYIYIHFCAL